MIQDADQRGILQRRHSQPHVLVLVGAKVELPPELEALAAHFNPRLPDANALLKMLREEAEHKPLDTALLMAERPARLGTRAHGAVRLSRHHLGGRSPAEAAIISTE